MSIPATLFVKYVQEGNLDFNTCRLVLEVLAERYMQLFSQTNYDPEAAWVIKQKSILENLFNKMGAIPQYDECSCVETWKILKKEEK